MLFIFVMPLYGQDSRVYISGKVTDAQKPLSTLNELMIVNMETQHGFFGNSDGTFSISIRRNDTLLVGATGYSTVKICFADSVQKDSFYVTIRLTRLSVQLKEVRIFSPRDLDEIQKDIQKLGYKRSDYELSGIDALQSPITFLYQQFSRVERLKRHNRERINEDRRRGLLKELLHRYVAWDIIALQDEEFDKFIDFCGVSEDYMKKSTQYDFIEYIKGKYFIYRAMSR